MNAEIITIGDEILIGQIVDTNSAFIAKELNKVGIKVVQITSIQDQKQHILDALEDAKTRAKLVLVTGGLGPTKDDITKETFLEYFEDTLVENIEVLNHIKHIFEKYIGRNPLPSNLSQALVPSKAIVLKNENGTAPGMWMEKDRTVFVSMPGVPFEMKQVLTTQVIPRVIKKFKTPFIYHKTLLTYGMGESQIQDIIEDWESRLPIHVKLAYLPSLGRVRLRLSCSGLVKKDVIEAVDSQMNQLHQLVNDIAVGYEDETNIIERIGFLLKNKNQTLSVAESCTGGTIAQEITAIAGASAFFKGGLVPYETAMKTKILGIDATFISTHNVVSIPVAEKMATQCALLFDTDFALATTGIAGPTKGDGMDEVGTVCIAIATPHGVFSEKFCFGNARERVIQKTVNKSFEIILKEILKN